MNKLLIGFKSIFVVEVVILKTTAGNKQIQLVTILFNIQPTNLKMLCKDAV